jgi:hypothetical protein
MPTTWLTSSRKCSLRIPAPVSESPTTLTSLAATFSLDNKGHSFFINFTNSVLIPAAGIVMSYVETGSCSAYEVIK